MAVVVPFPNSTPLDVQSMLAPLMESLQSELQHLIAVHLEEVLCPLREEASTIKLWLACVASRLERVEPCEEHAPISNLADLFGPCSPVRSSPAPLILASLVAACTHADSIKRKDTCADNAESVINEMTIEVAKRTLGLEIHQKLPTEQAFEVPCGTSTSRMLEPLLLQTITSIEDVVLVEDASDDEEAILDAQVTIKDPILLVTIEDSSTQSTVEVMAEEPRLLEDPLIEEVSSLAAIATNDEDLAYTPTLSPSPLTTKTRRRRNSYDG
jgi:hypothetical protein